MRIRRHYRYTLQSLAPLFVAGLVMVIAVATAIAKPLTGGGATGSMIYGGVALVTTGGATDSLLELGNNGQEIAGTSDIYLRPNYLTEQSGPTLQSIKIQRPNNAAGLTTVYVPGGVCFDGSPCTDQWPAGGAGTSLWTISGTHLATTTALQRVQFTKNNPSSATPYALELIASNVDTTLGANNSGGPAARFGDGGVISGNLYVDQRGTGDEIMMVDPSSGASYRVWHAGNDGHTVAPGTGPDARYLDGAAITFYHFPAANTVNPGYCQSTPGTDRECLCFDFGSPFNNQCFVLQ